MLEVTKGERGVVRVFTTDLEPRGDAAITPRNVEKLLGNGISLDSKKVEVFPAGAVETIGLPFYLQEGYGVPAEAMAGKSAVLEALSGLVILIPSSAFKGEAASLDPNPALRFIAAFEEEKTLPPVRMARSDASEGHLSPTGKSRQDHAARQRIRSWIIAIGALVLAAVIFVALA